MIIQVEIPSGPYCNGCPLMRQSCDQTGLSYWCNLRHEELETIGFNPTSIKKSKGCDNGRYD